MMRIDLWSMGKRSTGADVAMRVSGVGGRSHARHL